MPRKGNSALRKAQAKYKSAKKKPPGEGSRFKALKGVLKAKGAKSPGGLAAWIGRKRYNKKKMAEWSAKGRKKK